MSLSIQHIQISRADFDALASKNAYAIYFVIEADATISLYTGDKAVSQDVRMVTNVASVTNALAGKVYYDTTAKTCFIYNGTSFVYLMGDTYVFHYETMPEVSEADNGRTAIYTGATDTDKGLIQGNAYKVIGGVWAGITQESSNLQLAGLDYTGTTVLSKDSVASAGTADVAARADHSHALSAETIAAIEEVAVLRTDVDSNTAAISVHSASISSNTTEIGNVKISVASNTGVIATHSQAIESLELSVMSNTDDISSNTLEIGSAKLLIASNTQSISDLSGVVNANSTLFSTDIASNTQAISDLSVVVNNNSTTFSTDIASNTQAISDLEVVVNNNSTTFSEAISSNSTEIGSAKELIASNTDAIGVNTAAINVMSISVTSNTQSISDLSGVVNANSTTFSEAIASNTDAISANNAAISSNFDAIASLTQLCTWSIYTA